MPANVAAVVDCPLEIFGGLVSDLAPNDLPEGASPDNQDVAFQVGLVKTRPGLQNVFAAIPGNPTINYLKTYITQNQILRMLALDSLGNVYKENPIGTLSSIGSVTPGEYAKSASQFTREYMAFGDGKFGLDIPRQYDDTNFDRVSQVGPGNLLTGAGPGTGEVFDAAAESALTIAAAPSGAVRSGGQVTITTTTNHGYNIGQAIVVAGVTDGSFDGTFAVLTVPSATTFTYAQAGANATSGSGTATLQPGFAAGIHLVSFCFKTRQGYITPPMPPMKWNTAGGRRCVANVIPTGPSNVTARIALFTLAAGASFFYLGSTTINDNTTTTATFDIYAPNGSGEAVLAAGTSADYLFKLVELGECQGVIDYASRNFWWGERNKLQNLQNLSFSGGFTPFDSGRNPSGWSGPTDSNGGKVANGGVFGDAYSLGGSAAQNALITQPAFQDINGVPINQPNTAYSVRVRALKQSQLASQGTLVINLFSTSGGINTAGLQVPVNTMSQSYQEFIGTLTAGIPNPIPSDLVLQVYLTNTPAGTAGAIQICNIEIFPTSQPFNTSLVRVSRVEDPESYDGVNGIMLFGENDGKRITAAFKLRNNLYFVKETSLWQTADDGVNEPAKWAINQVSGTVGTPSVNGVGLATDWVVIAGRTGLFFYNGGEPEKISQEIQRYVLSANGTKLPGWDQINWAAGQTIWCVVDEFNRRIMVGAPVNGATSPNMVFTLDYRGLDTGTDITNHKSIHISAYTGKIYDIADSRKWTRWNMTTNSAAMIERPDGIQHVFMGNGAGTGKIYDLLDVENFAAPATFGDDGVAINSYYDTYLFIRPDQEQQLQLGSHRKLYPYLTAFMEGQGTPSLFAIPPGNFPPIALPQSGNSLPPLVTQLFPVSITSISRTSNVVTVVTAAPHNLMATSAAVINGTGNAAFDAQAFGNLGIINANTFNFILNGPNIGAIATGTVAPLIRDVETPVNILAERCRFRVNTNALGAWFSFRNLTVSLRIDPWAPVRGIN